MIDKNYKVAVAGLQHETNTFAPHKAHYEDFLKADSWPGLTLGDDIFSKMDGLNIPLPGFIAAAELEGFEIHPVYWGSAEPSSYVAEEAFERLTAMLCQSIQDAGPLDAVYLDLHGAMVAEHFEDGEGEILRRVRAIVGSAVPIVISLDLHANISNAMLEYTDAITVFRTYPHLDMAETGARACALLTEILSGKALVGGIRKIPFLIPLTSQCTDFEPCKSIYADIAGTDSSDISSVDFACGFPPADIKECGAAIVVYGADHKSVEVELERLYSLVLDAEPRFVNELLSADEAVQRAMQVKSDQPVVIADAQDNPGAGGTSDTVGMLNALVRNRAKGALMAVIFDPEVASQAHAAGLKAEVSLSVGGKFQYPGVEPFVGKFLVENLGDGNFTCTGEMYKNSQAELGPMALLRAINPACDVRVIISSDRFQCLDLAVIRHLGVEPENLDIIIVKSSVHFRADFDPIAAQTLIAAAPGAHPCQLEKLAYKNLRRGVRLGPMGVPHV